MAAFPEYAGVALRGQSAILSPIAGLNGPCTRLRARHSVCLLQSVQQGIPQPAHARNRPTEDTMSPTRPHPSTPPVDPPSTPAPAPTPASGPGRREPLTINMPAAKVTKQALPDPAEPDLRLPHERDQSGVDVTAATPDPVVVQAAKDIAAGLVDTDLRNPGGLDDGLRRKLLKQQR